MDRPERFERPVRIEREDRVEREERAPREEIEPVAPVSFGRPSYPERAITEHPSSFEPEPPTPARDVHEAPDFQDEPIDRISAFGGERATDGEPTAARPEFGRTSRPFTQHRKGRQVKPREQKHHRSLGGEPSSADESPTMETPRRIAVEGKIGMSDGIGPIDLDDRGESERS
jgi:hypothetical protein